MKAKLTDIRSNYYDRAKVMAMSSQLYDENDWRKSINDGTADTYVSLMLKLNKTDPNEFYTKYGLYYGDQQYKMSAMMNEAWADRDVVKEYKTPKTDGNGNFVYDENGNQLFDTKEYTEYDYNLEMLSNVNRIYAENAKIKSENDARNERKNFWGSVGAILGQLGTSIVRGAEQFGAWFYSTADEIVDTAWHAVKAPFSKDYTSDTYFFDYIKGDKTFAQRASEYMSGDRWDVVSDDMQARLDQFAYNYANFYDDNGNLTTFGRWALGAADTIGKMIPTMLLTKGLSLYGGALSASAASTLNTSKVGTYLSANAGTIGQINYYGANVFTPEVAEQYEYYASKGISVSSDEILMNAAVKTGLQFAIERGLTKFLGKTGIDGLLWGKDPKANILRFSSKKLTANTFLRLGKDALQEGLEESLQETSDFLVDGFHHFINHDFQATEWSWQAIGDAFAIAMITSVLGDSAKILGTKRITTDVLKTDKNGNLVKDKDGNYEYKKLNKFASYEYALDLESYIESLDNVKSAGTEIQNLWNNLNEDEKADVKNNKRLDKAVSQYVAAYYEALTSFQLLSGLYGEMGQERFNKANEILKQIRQNKEDGVYDNELRLKAQEEIVNSLILTRVQYSIHKNQLLSELEREEVTKIDTQVTRDGGENIDEDFNKVAQQIFEKDKTVNRVIFSNGKGIIHAGEIMIVPSNLAKNDPNAVVIFANDAEKRLADQLVEEVLSTGANINAPIDIILELYKQWSGRDDVTRDEAVMNLIFEPSFFNCVLVMNEKETVSFLLKLRHLIDNFRGKDNLRDKLFAKRIQEMKTRWTIAAIDFYANNIDADYSNYSRFLKGKELTDFEKEVNERRAVFKISSKFVQTPDKVTDREWEFMNKRIDNALTSNENKDRIRDGLKSNNAVDRANAMFELNTVYDGALQTLYNGEWYLPCTSVANMVFNNYLKQLGLGIGNFLEPSTLSDVEKEQLGNRDILEFRQDQFRESVNGKYNFIIGNDGKIMIKSDDRVVGWSAIDKTLLNGPTLKNIYEGKEVNFETGKKTVSSRRFATGLQSTSKYFRSLLNKSVHEQGISMMVSIDDVINNALYLTDEIQDEIIDKYGDLSPDNVFVYLQEKFAMETDGKASIVFLRDGSVAIADMSKLGELFSPDARFDLRGKYELKQFVSNKIRSKYTDSATVVFGAAENRYVDYELVPVNGKLTYVFVNRIELRSGPEESVKFAFAHELQHLLQFEKSMNCGMSDRALELFDEKTQNEIIKSVKELLPDLFTGKLDIVRTKNIVNRYLYLGTGEMQAMGLSSTKELAFYPVRSKRYANGKVDIILPNGKTFTAEPKIKGTTVNTTMTSKVNNVINDYYSKYKPRRVNGNTFSKRFKKASDIRSKIITDDNSKTKENYLEMLYNYSGFDMTYDEFLKQELILTEIDGKLYFVNDIRAYQTISSYLKPFGLNTNIKFGTLTASEIKSVTPMRTAEGILLARIDANRSKIKNKRIEKIDFTDVPKDMSQSLTAIDPVSEKDYTQSVADRFNDYIIQIDYSNLNTLSSPQPGECIEDSVKNKELLYLLEKYLFRQPGERTDVSLKDELLNCIKSNSDEAEHSLKILKNMLGFNDITDEEFLTKEIPIIRFESSYYASTIDPSMNGVIDDQFVSATILTQPYGVNEIIVDASPYEHNSADVNFTPLMGNFYVNRVKVSDLLYFVPTYKCEVFVKPDSFVGGKSLFVDFSDGLGLTSALINDDDEYILPFDDVNSTVKRSITENDVSYKSWEELKEHIIRKIALGDINPEMERKTGIVEGNRLNYKERKKLLTLFEKMIPCVERILSNLKIEGKSPAFRFLSKPTDNMFDRLAYYRPTSHDITYGIGGDYADTLIHELLHFVCEATLSGSTMSRELIGLRTRMYALYNRCLESNIGLNMYGFYDIHEFVSELTNPDFVDVLDKTSLGDLEYIYQHTFGSNIKTVLEALNIEVDLILNNAQYLSDDYRIDEMLNMNYYTGPLYDGSKLVNENVENYSVAKFDTKIIKTLNQLIPKNQDESNLEYVKRLLSMDDKYRKAIIKHHSNQFGDSITAIYLDGTFVIYDGKVSDYTIEPVETVEASDEIKSENNGTTDSDVKLEDKVETKTEEVEKSTRNVVKDPRQKRGYVADEREILRREINPEIHKVRYTPLPTGITKKDIDAGKYKIVTDVDRNLNEEIRSHGNENAKYFYRKFLYRLYYTNKYGKDTHLDVYEMWSEKTDDERQYATVEELEDRYLKNFKKKGKEQLRINPEFRKFILSASKSGIKLPKEIQDKIDGEDKGTLTKKDLQLYIFETPSNEITEEFFKLFNESFYQNKHISSISELKKYEELLPKIQALYLALRKTEYKDWIYDEYTLEELEDIFQQGYNSTPKVREKIDSYLESFELKVTQDTYYDERKSRAKSEELAKEQAKNSKNTDEESYNNVILQEPLSIDWRYVLHKLMRNYDGTIMSGAFVGKDARIDAWHYDKYGSGNLFRSDKRDVSLSDTVGEGYKGDESTQTLEEVLEDEEQRLYFDEFEYYYNSDRNKLIKELTDTNRLLALSDKLKKDEPLYWILMTIRDECKKQNLTGEQTQNAIASYFRNVVDATYTTNESLARMLTVATNKFDENIVPKSDLELVKDDIHYLADLEIDEDSDKSIKNKYYKEPEKKRLLSSTTRRQYNLKKVIREKAKQISDYLKGQSVKSVSVRTKFLELNSNLFELNDDNSITFKESLLYEKVSDTELLRSEDELYEINELLKSIKTEIKNDGYSSDNSFKLLKENRKLKKQLSSKNAKPNKSDKNVYRLSLGNGNTLDIDENATVPQSIKEMIELGKAKEAATKVQQFSKQEEQTDEDGKINKVYTEKHALLVYDNFLENAADILAKIGQEGADEIVDFYLGDKVVIIAGNDDRIAMNLQQLLLGYLYSRHFWNDLTFNDERLAKIESYLETQASIAGSWLSNQKTILNMLKRKDSGAIVSQSLASYYGIPLESDDLKRLAEYHKALRNINNGKTESQKAYQKAKETFMQGLLEKHKGNKRSLLSKIWRWEQAMMLSSPATGVRSAVSNAILKVGNIASGKVGYTTFKVLQKVFPKSKAFSLKNGQYKIIGTKPTKEVTKFVDNSFYQSGFIDDVIKGLNKYDPRKLSKSSSNESIIDMLAKSAAYQIVSSNTFTKDNAAAKFGNFVIEKVFQMTSDDKFIKGSVKTYLSKIIQEEMDADPKFKLELKSNNLYGLSNKMLELFVEAYRLAAFDYMHTPNIVSELEGELRRRLGEKGFFVYKQFFPFLSASWNWSVEGMRYTNFGLAKAIYDLSKLENTIDKLDKMEREGKGTISSDLAQYIAIRNLGKGVIGTICFMIGITLVCFNLAGIDREDDRYKLIVGSGKGEIKIDINDVVGSQGIMLGIATASEIKREDKDPLNIIAEVLNQFFDESVFEDIISSIRGRSGTGGYLVDVTTDDIPSMFWPNLLRWLTAVSNKNGITYDDGVKGWMQRFAAKNLPFGGYIFGANTQVDIYTGKQQSYSFWEALGSLVNKTSPIDIELTRMSDVELEVVSQGVHKTNLTGNYTVDGDKVSLTSEEQVELNVFYAELNSESLDELFSKGKEIKRDGKYKKVKYSNMTDKEKKAAIESVLSTNSQYSKIYILTSTGRYKYYASDSEYETLRKLGIKTNVYRKTKKLEGFVKIN